MPVVFRSPVKPHVDFLADSRFSWFKAQSLPSLLGCCRRSFTFYLGLERRRRHPV